MSAPEKFQRSSYWNKLAQEVWRPCRDLLDEFWSSDIKRRHLYPRPAEPAEAYNNRLRAAYLDNWFSSAVSSYAALLGKFSYTQEPNAPPRTITESDRAVPEAAVASNVDFQGNDFKAFMNLLNQSTLALGCALVVIDVQDTTTGKRPYMRRWDVDDIYGLRTIQEGGQTYIASFCGRYEIEEEEEDGSLKTCCYYLQYIHRPARAILWEEEDGELKIESETPIKGADGKQLQELPVVWHDFSGEPVGYPPLPILLSLAKLNISNFNSLSEFQTILTVVNGPTPLVFWPPGSPPPSERPDLYLGINTAYHMPAGGDVRFLEPSGNALNISWSVIQGQREMMARLGQSFFSPGFGRTATEAKLDAAQSESIILSMSNRVQNTAEEIFKWWSVFSDPAYKYPDYAGGLCVNTEALALPMNPAESAAIESKFLNGLIDVKTAINLLIRGGWLQPEDLSEEMRGILGK